MPAVDSFTAKDSLALGDETFEVFRIDRVPGHSKLPYSLKILLENLLRNEDGRNITKAQIDSLASWVPSATPDTEVRFTPSRVIMPDSTGVPCVVDLATMREAMKDLGGDPEAINPMVPAELVIDHSVIAESFGSADSFRQNVVTEYGRNLERYQFLRWGQSAFDDLRVVPPGTGIVHQVNLEYLARVVQTRTVDGVLQAFPDTLVGTDSHTPMVNGLGVLGWGVGGIEAEAALLGQPISMLIPKVVGFKLRGSIPSGVTATDVVLTITQLLRDHGVVGSFVEFYGEGVGQVPLSHRATIGNMSPEFGSTVSIFPIDQVTLDYLRFTGRSESQVALVEAYAKLQKLWHEPEAAPVYSQYVELDLDTVVPSIAGPKRPQDRIDLTRSKVQFESDLSSYTSDAGPRSEQLGLRNAALRASSPSQHSHPAEIRMDDHTVFAIDHGAVAIAAITSCTNTSNPSVMVAAGLLARNAREKGLTSKPWVKTTFAPGSKVVTDYYNKAGLTPYLEELGFFLVGYGCTVCIGNTGPLLSEEIASAVQNNDLAVAAVLSGNRNFEGRIHSQVKMNYLASPPLVVAYALAGSMNFDFETDPLGIDGQGDPVFLRDIWPDPADVERTIEDSIDTRMFTHRYSAVFDGDEHWQSLPVPPNSTFDWDINSTYIRKPPFFDGITMEPVPVTDISEARVLAVLGDTVTTDHISPFGSIKSDSPAGYYLEEHGVRRPDYNSYGSRRGNHEVMIRGTFANIRLRNQLLDGVEGGYTRDFTKPGGPQTFIFDASQNYDSEGIPLIIIAGKDYGTGSSRDWAAKGTRLLGVRAIIAESFERIHRSNLIGMGLVPLQFPEGQTAASLGIDGTEVVSISGLDGLESGAVPKTVRVVMRPSGNSATGAPEIEFDATVRIDTPGEADYYRHGGILQYVLRSLASQPVLIGPYAAPTRPCTGLRPMG